VVPSEFNGYVVAMYTATSGEVFIGTIELGWDADHEEGLPPEPLRAHHQIWYREDGTPAWTSLYLGHEGHATAEAMERVKRKGVETLGIDANRLFPMVVRPALPIESFPSLWTLRGFMITDRTGKREWSPI
jgi:hypothetical protein